MEKKHQSIMFYNFERQLEMADGLDEIQEVVGRIDTWPLFTKSQRKELMMVARICTGLLDGISVDVMCGGFPCQDISVAGIPNGTQVGISGARSGLWKEYWRLIGELRPRFAIMENTAALVSQGLGTVLGDLSRIGYDAEWHSLAAGELGAPHNRARVWVVAYPMRERLEGGVQTGNAAGEGLAWGASAQRHISQLACGQIRNHWQDIPDVCGVADGVSERVDRHWAKRIKCLGNTVVPQVVEEIGRAIMAASRGE